MPKGKVVYVDFGKGSRPVSSAFGGGPRLALAVFLSVLALEILGAALLWPSSIASSFFGPTTIAVAVACAVGASRLAARVRAARHREAARPRRPDPEGDEARGRTLH